jgi:hypothetical protein
MGIKTGLDDVEKRTFLILQGFELQLFGCPARSQLKHRLCCPGSSYPLASTPVHYLLMTPPLVTTEF